MWVPRVTVARRCGAKLITAHRGGGVELTYDQQFACVDVISHPYVSRKLCRLLGVLWMKMGRQVLDWELSQEEPVLRHKPELDPALEQVLASAG